MKPATDRFADHGFETVTLEQARAAQKQVAKEQKAAVAKVLANKPPATPVEASGDIWLL